MGLWISTRSQAANDHGVFAEERSLPAVITPIGTGTVGLVGQFPWGPDDKVIVPTDTADRDLTIAPLGMDRTGAGYMAVFGKSWPDLRLVRVLGTAAAKAVAPLLNATPAICVNVTALYKGVAGNSMVAVVSAASDADANHFNLDVTVTNALGSTIESFVNINFSGVGADSVVDCSSCRLVGSITRVLTARPVNGSYNFATGADGSIVSARYLGTPGNGDTGLALFEGDPEVDMVLADDCSNALRAAVNAGLLAHQLLMGDRIAIINGNSANTPALAQTDVVNYQSTGAAYVDAWHYQRDQSGTERLVAPAPVLACVMANLSASTSAAWKAQEVRTFTSFITRLEASRGAAAKANAAKGICTLIKEATGGYTFHAAVNTAAPVSPAKKNLTRTRMGIYIAKSLQDSLRDNVDAPNVSTVQNDLIRATAGFLEGLKDAVKDDPKHQVHIVNWGWLDINALNPAASIAAGDFTLPFQVTTSAGMERIYLSIEYGETVVVKAAP